MVFQVKKNKKQSADEDPSKLQRKLEKKKKLSKEDKAVQKKKQREENNVIADKICSQENDESLTTSKRKRNESSTKSIKKRKSGLNLLDSCSQNGNKVDVVLEEQSSIDRDSKQVLSADVSGSDVCVDDQAVKGSLDKFRITPQLKQNLLGMTLLFILYVWLCRSV